VNAALSLDFTSLILRIVHQRNNSPVIIYGFPRTSSCCDRILVMVMSSC